jgi:hypothetical protein
VSPIFADVVWPALFLVDRLTAWWCVGTGLVIEFAILRWALQLPTIRTAFVTIAMNVASSAVGWLTLPWWGWNWEWVVQVRNEELGYGTFNPFTWAETCVLACCLSTVIEWFCLQIGLIGLRRPTTKSSVGWLLVANAVTVSLAYGSLWVVWPRT